MAGGDDDLDIHASLSGDLADALRRIEQRLDGLEGKLDDAGRAGERAGDKIERGADDAAEALQRVSAAGEEATEDLFGLQKAADKAGDELADVGKSGGKAAAGLEAAQAGAESAAEALDDTGRQAKQAARALDDAGDEAAQAGAKAAASSLGWGKLWAALDRNERITSRWGRTQDSMRWSAWTARADKFKTSMSKLLDPGMWDKGAAGLNKISKAFGGFSAIMMAAKIGAIVSAVIALIPLLSALAAGAVAAAGGLASMAPGLAAVLPLFVAGKLAMLAWKAASKILADQVKGIGDKWKAEIGTAVAETGGLRKALDYFSKNSGKLLENVASGFAIIGKGMSKSVRDVTDYTSKYDFLKDLGKMWDGLGPIVERFGAIASRVLHFFVNLIRMATPAAQELTETLEHGAGWLADWAKQMADSGRGAAIITKAYHGLAYAVGVVWDFMQGLFALFRIGAQESGWMATSIHDMAQKFDKWTHSIKGENAIRTWFQDAKPVLQEVGLLIRDLFKGFGDLAKNQDVAPLIKQIRTELLPPIIELAKKFQGDLLPKIIDFFSKLAEMASKLDLNALTIVLSFLIGVANACLWVAQNVPGGNAALSTLFTTLLLAGPVSKVLGLLTGGIGKLVLAGKWLAVAFKGGEGLSLMQKVVFQLGRGVMWLLRLLMGPLVKGILWVGRILAMAFLGSNPIGWIILAIIALVGIFWWCYENIEGFRNAVNAAMSGLWAFLTGDILNFQDNVWKPLVNTLKEEWQEWYDQVFKPIGDGIAFAFGWIGQKLAELGVWWDAQTAGMAQSWNNFYSTWIQPVADFITRTFDRVGTALSGLGTWFDGTVTMIGQVWNRMRGLLARPVNFMIGTVWNRGILPAWNWVAEKVGLPPGKEMGLIPEYATGGAIRGPGTGTSDSILAAVSNGEHVLTAREVAALGGHDSVMRMRQAAMSGMLPRFATGGPVAGATATGTARSAGIGEKATGSVTAAPGGVAGWAWSWAKPLLSNIIDPIINAIPFRAPPQFLDIPRAMATTGRDKMFAWAETKLNEWGATTGGADGGGAMPSGMGAAAVRAAVQAVAARYGWGAGPEWNALDQLIAHESGWRPNAANPTSSARGLFQKLTRANGPIEPTVAGQAMWGLNYIRGRYGSPSRAWGAWLSRKPHWYDDGGMLPPGLSMVMNGTGQPEPVFTAGQWDMLDPTNIVSAMQSTPPTLEAQAASSREDELAGAVRSLASMLAERPPAMSVSGDDTRRAVLDALSQRDRERRVKERYRYD